KFIASMTVMGYRPKAPVPVQDFAKKELRERWASEKNMRVFSFFHPKKPFELVDVFIGEPIPFADAYARRKNVDLESMVLPVISGPDLIKLKKISARPQDLEDIKMIEALQKDGGDQE
ncbi:MAG: hypothetical protein KGI84_08835, partial [Elusimicrobia bacterium]|nr:hypothetical protein [Elusimicrobiota bacterium]